MGPEVAGVGFDGGGRVGVGLVVEAVGAEEDGLVGLRLAERERQERPRRVPLRLAQRRRCCHRYGTVWELPTGLIAGVRGGRGRGCLSALAGGSVRRGGRRGCWDIGARSIDHMKRCGSNSARAPRCSAFRSVRTETCQWHGLRDGLGGWAWAGQMQ